MLNRVKQIANTLGISENDVAKLLEDDENIDKGGRCEWEPSIEEEKAMKKLNRVEIERKKPNTRITRQADTDKQTLINAMFAALSEITNDIILTHKERIIDCTYNNEKYTIVLTKHHD